MRIEKPLFYLPVLTLLSVLACSFDYGIPPDDTGNEPDIVMQDVEYVRMENSNPVARINAEEARRYEERHTMELDDFTFEQYNSSPPGSDPDVNVSGRGGEARVQTDSGNLSMDGGFSITVKSEDISIDAKSLYWQDK
jgi:hypothetical protein